MLDESASLTSMGIESMGIWKNFPLGPRVPPKIVQIKAIVNRTQSYHKWVLKTIKIWLVYGWFIVVY